MAADPPGTNDEPRFGSRFGTSRAMSDAEIEELLSRNWWGNLATLEETGPYAVPVVYGYDGESFYVASRSGRKVSNVEANPAVCLTVVEVEGHGAAWASAVVRGDAELVRGVRELIAALRALRRQVGRTGKVTPADVGRMAAARVMRISPREITGRTRID